MSLLAKSSGCWALCERESSFTTRQRSIQATATFRRSGTDGLAVGCQGFDNPLPGWMWKPRSQTQELINCIPTLTLPLLTWPCDLAL